MNILQKCSFRSSNLEVLCKKGVVKNLAKFTERSVCQGLSFYKETLAQVLFREFCEIFKNTLFKKH